MLSVCLLVSGELGYDLLQDLWKKYDLKAVFTDAKSLKIIKFCNANTISIYIGNPRGGKAREFISNIDCQVLLSINYLFIIEPDIINLPSILAINIHGSLLPKYRGRTPHVWAIINGERETGITAHLIDEEVDNGDIAHQMIVPIKDDVTGGEILKEFKKLYPKVIDDVLIKIDTGQLKLIKQDQNKATYFGKRTPLDGKINWNWSKERIKNWVRAQADPYPGAFTFYNNRKVKIHKVSIVDCSFNYLEENGTILQCNNSSNQLTIKTSNGCLLVSNLVYDNTIIFKIGDILK